MSYDDERRLAAENANLRRALLAAYAALPEGEARAQVSEVLVDPSLPAAGIIEALDDLSKFVPYTQPTKEQRDEWGIETNEDMPFFTEGYLYATMGKDEGRSVLMYVKRLARAAGVPEEVLMRYL